MMAAHDTDNIPQIAGLPVHPVQAAEQARIAAALAQNATANAEVAAAPAPESVKDMSSATRQVLDKLSGMLKDARELAPSDAEGRPDRAEAPWAPAPGSVSKPGLASAGNGASAPQSSQPANPQTPAAPQTALSAGRDNDAATPQ
jgi:hypothetical protein